MTDIIGMNVEGVQYPIQDQSARQSVAQLAQTVAGKITNPSGGTVNDVLTKTANGVAWSAPQGGVSAWSDLTGKPFSTIGANLTVVNGALTVDTATIVEQDNTKPVTSGAVHVEIGNIETLLANI